MPVISFQLSASTDKKEQTRILGHLEKMAGVQAVGRIDGSSADKDVSRMCYAETSDAAHVPKVVEELHRTAGVEGVSVEPRRGLIS
jgi:hypothetical protein